MVYSSISSLSITGAGVSRAQWAIVDANGIPNGNLASGQDAPMNIYVGIKASNGQLPEGRVTDVTGDNGRLLHSYPFHPAQLGRLNLNFGVFDMNAYTKFSNTKIDASIGQWAFVGMETNAPSTGQQVFLLENADAKDVGSVSDGSARFVNFIYPLINIQSLGTNAAEAAAMDWGYLGVPTRSGKYPWGVSFTDNVNGFTKAGRLLGTSVYPLTLHTFVPSGATGSLILPFTPASDHTGYAIKAFNTSTQLPITLTSVVPGTRFVSYSGAGAGVPHIILYEAIDLLEAA